MKKSSKLTRTMRINGCMFMDSNESNSDDDDECRLPTAELVFSDHDQEKIAIKRQQSTSSIRNSIIKSDQIVDDINRISFIESEYTDSGIGHDTEFYGQSNDNKALNDHEDGGTAVIINDSHLYEDIHLEKTGWLNVKHWFTVEYYESFQFVSKHQWRRFWIQLKDSNLLLFNNYSDSDPKLTINLTDCLCYPLSGRRQYVFSLTTHTGDTYCFQSSNQFEINHWIHCIHSDCLSKFDTNMLKSNLKQLKNDILHDHKMLKLAELQLKLSTDDKIRLLILKQIELWEKKLDIYHLDFFRKKCYLSTLDENENLPDSKDLLSQISPSTKSILCNLDAFTPCGIYSCIISRRRLDHQKSETRSPESISPIQTDLTVIFDSNPQKRIKIPVNKTTTVGELLKNTSDKLGVITDDYFLYFYSTSAGGFLPDQNDTLNTLTYSSIEICQKMTYQVILKNQLNRSGIEIDHQNPTRIFLSNVKKDSEGERLGVIKGDEIIQINNSNIQDLDSNKLNRYLNQTPIILTLRSSRLRFYPTKIKTSEYIKPLPNTQHIQKITNELIETERSYIQDIQCLLNQYIKPLRNDSTVSPSDVIDALYQSIKSIYQLQSTFFENLQLNLLNQNIIISICGTFINFSKHFKLYSTYCSIHLQLTRLLNDHKTNEYLKEFLISCNPSQQHSLSFESYLIKPIQRILKYPLFLQQLFIYCNRNEINQILSLKKAIKRMNKITKYINSMQQLYEDFGQSFENFIKNSKGQSNMFERNLSDLYAYGEIDWLNIYRFISRKNYQYLKTFCFVFRNGCLLLVREQTNKKNQNTSDRFIRFLPMKGLEVELINDDNKQCSHTWQLIQTDPRTQLKTYFRFANKDALTFIKAINSCISTIKWQSNDYIHLSQLSSSVKQSSSQNRLTPSRSCYDLLPKYSLSNQYSDKNEPVSTRRSPSPIWKRRTTSLRKRPLSMTNNKNFN